MTKFLMLVTVIFAFSANIFAQVSATATAQATIVTPISIVKFTDMNFGNMSVNVNPGTVTLSAAAAPTRTPAGGVTLMPGGTIASARFDVSGLANATYGITLPANGTVSLTGPGLAMAVNTFVSSPATGTLSAGGTESFYVGATLSVGGSQTPGVYNTAAPFTVTVNYN